MKKLIYLCVLLVAACTVLAACKKCDSHVYDDCADTECNECGETRDSMHAWAEADCDTPKTCENCGKTEGAPLGHDYADADCVTARTCKICAATEGSALGHSYITEYDDHFHFEKCERCDYVDEESKARHELDDEFTCECGAEFTAKIEPGAESSTITKLINDDGLLIREYVHMGSELLYFMENYYDEYWQLVREEEYTDEQTLNVYTVYEYDENGDETKKDSFSADGEWIYSITSEYDESRNLIKREYKDNDGDGYVLENEYDEEGNCVKEEYKDNDGYAYVSEYEYDEEGNLIKESFVDSDGGERIFEYYENGTLKKDTYPGYDGRTVVLEYDENGVKIKESQLFDDGSSYVVEFDENGNIIKTTDIDTDGSWESTQSRYDDNGNKIETVETNSDGNTHRTTFGYSDEGVLVNRSEFNYDGYAVHYEYGSDGNIVKETNEYVDGSIYTKEFYEDETLKKSISEQPDGSVFIHEYNEEDGEIKFYTEINPDGSSRQHEYKNKTIFRDFYYSADGTFTIGYEYEFYEDGTRLMEKEINADGTMEIYEYDTDGKIMRVIYVDAEGNETVQEY